MPGKIQRTYSVFIESYPHPDLTRDIVMGGQTFEGFEFFYSFGIYKSE